MQYQSAKSELQSPPQNVSLLVIVFEAATMLLAALLLYWMF